MEASAYDEAVLQLSVVWEASCKAVDCDARDAISKVIFDMEGVLRYAGRTAVRVAQPDPCEEASQQYL